MLARTTVGLCPARSPGGQPCRPAPKALPRLNTKRAWSCGGYLCPAHRWTIGAGLTAASGVIVPKAGMVITREGATAALAQALERNYEPRVRKAMPGAKQHEFDAGVSFDFNTGAIHKATWVKRWLSKVAPAVIRDSLAQWNKGGGKVLPGLVSRRKREADMLLLGVYPSSASPPVVPPDLGAQWRRRAWR